MKKLLIFMLLVGTMSLFAGLNIEIGFDIDVVGETGEEPFVSEYFHITNVGETAEYTIGLNIIDITEGWFMTWCHDDLSDVGLNEGCHHFTQPWTFTFPAEAVLAVDFQVNNMANNEGMVHFEYVITGGDLVEPIILPFTFRTVNYVSNENSELVPNITSLSNFPNPFNPETTINFSLNKGSHIKLEVFNILGQHINTLVNEYKSSGNHGVLWAGKDKNNNNLSSGIYLYKMTAGGQTKLNKMILIK
ncbi:T9SS type A sorting domain-containing protein [bacterium]|nr:T9SS type A sorting domain-containing protein [bacterium]